MTFIQLDLWYGKLVSSSHQGGVGMAKFRIQQIKKKKKNVKR